MNRQINNDENDLEEKLLLRTQDDFSSEGQGAVIDENNDHCIVEIDSKGAPALTLDFKTIPLMVNNFGFKFVDIKSALNQFAENKQISSLVKDAWNRNQKLLSLHLSSKEFANYIEKTQQFFRETHVDTTMVNEHYNKKPKRYAAFFLTQVISSIALGAASMGTKNKSESWFDASNEIALNYLISCFVLAGSSITQIVCMPFLFRKHKQGLPQAYVAKVKLGIYAKTLDAYCKELYEKIVENLHYKKLLREESGLPEALINMIEDYESEVGHRLR